MADSYFPRWRAQPDAVEGRIVGIDERLAWPQMFAMGIQHVVAMFGSTVLAPLLMGFDPNLCIFMSGVGTRWIETLMPPVVTGAIVCVIGLNLAPIAVRGVSASNFDSWMALVT